MPVENAPIGTIGLIKELPDGRIVQIGLSKDQFDALQLFLASMSKEKAFIQLPEKFDLIIKSKNNDKI